MSEKRPETSPHTEKRKKVSGKGPEKSNAAHVISIDPNGLPDIKLALEVLFNFTAVFIEKLMTFIWC